MAALVRARRYVFNVLHAARVIVTSVADPRSRLLLGRLRDFAEAPVVEPFQAATWDDFFGEVDDEEIGLGRVRETPGNTWLYEIAVLCTFVRVFGFKTIFEIGTFDGRTTYNLALHAGEGGRVVTVNLPQGRLVREWIHVQYSPVSGCRFHGTSVQSRIEELFCDSTRLDATPYEDSFQMVFIDGDHSAAAVCSDAKLAVRLINKRGLALIGWHDADFWSVQSGICKFVAEAAWPQPYRLVATRLAFAPLFDGRPATPSRFAQFARQQARKPVTAR